MTLVWLSSGLPADRSELAAALPSQFSLVPPNPAADPNTAADVGVLPVGSLCVATVFETGLVAQLADRPAGVGLLVIGPTAGDGVTEASSVPELAAAIQQAANTPAVAPEFPTAPLPFAAGLTAPAAADLTAAGDTPVAADGRTKTPMRTRLIAAGAVALGLAIGGVVIGTTEGTSAATATRGGGFGNFGGQLPGGQVPGGSGAGGAAGAAGTGGAGAAGAQGGARSPFGGAATREIVACLRRQGITIPTNQLLQNTGDPKLQQAFFTCVQQLRGGSSSAITGRP